MKKIIYLILLLLFVISCAVQGPIPGGEIDKKGPELEEVRPVDYSMDIKRNEKIILFFDEAIDPNSVYKSLEINNSEHKVTVIGKRIIIRPKDQWNMESILNIKLSRELSDYYKNSINKPVNLFFSFGQQIPSGLIKGKILDINNILNHLNESSESKIYEVGLYKVNGSERVLKQKTQTNQNLEFVFNAVDNGTYSIIAINKIIIDPKTDITQREYAISYHDVIVSDKNLEHSILLNSGEPILKKNISSIDFINGYYVNYNFTDGSNQFGVIDTIYNNLNSNFSGMELNTLLTLQNQFEQYTTDPFKFIVPNIIDTISPAINLCELNNFNALISFSEPLDYYDSLDSLFYFYNDIDSSRIYIEAVSYKNQGGKPYINEIILPPFLNNKMDSVIYIRSNTIKDLSGNYLSDSIISLDQCLDTINTNGQPNFGYGGLIGTIDTDNTNQLIVVAYNTLTGISKRIMVNDNKFTFEMLRPGKYFLQVYENYQSSIDIIYPYFPGQWDSFKHSMKFSEFIGPVEVRKNWYKEGINISFKEGGIAWKNQ